VGVGLGTRPWVEPENKAVGGGLGAKSNRQIHTPQLFPHTVGDALKQATSFYCKMLASANQCHTGLKGTLLNIVHKIISIGPVIHGG